ncbi:MAG: exodeoxyribonuclease VII small subunit [Bacteroidaceae bacterium]|jgi:exodeoxyribonuclease VII small subunit|nr:exodeoxyribonuclease VII small subunit [Bacteroidaceae bacterium]MBO7272344.1 exodeoxyribonuclease VII small subunit [Bacteroidaceae bacterium]MBQ2290238.1 exodeoxyribonuclease VII small subunit [Bacteroidaceae bacterium]MBQ5617476.1 exodeoxyribonuclease VII small subunit [Bacteroidaceae bacterium]
MENLTYTQAVERLEEIMSSIQGGGMDVDKLAVALKEASALVQFCRGKLYKVDEEVKLLLENMDDETLC